MSDYYNDLVPIKKPEYILRPATPNDVPGITAIHCSNIARWLRWEADGTSHPARYADLTPYERWQHGGPWLDEGTCRTHLERLIAGGGFPLVADVGGRLLATAELHLATEPPPYGRNLNLSTLYVHRNHQGQGLGSALLDYSIELARSNGCHTFLVANAEAPDFYKQHGLKQAERWVQYRLSISKRPELVEGRAPYNLEPLPDASYELVQGYALPIGRYQNACHDWDRTRPNATPNFPQWRGLKLERYWLTLGKQRVAVIFEESPHQRGTAEVFLFTQIPFTSKLIAAIRGLGGQLGFTHLQFFVRSDVQPMGGVKTGVEQKLFLKRL